MTENAPNYVHAFSLYKHDCLALASFLLKAAESDPAGASFDVSEDGFVKVYAAGQEPLTL